MLKRLWRWLKRSFQCLFGNRQTPPLEKPRKVESPKQLTDAEYESLFLELLAEVNDGLSRGGAKGFLAANRINEAHLVEWLRGFGERLLALPTPNDELATRMVRLGELSIGEVSVVAYDIGRRLEGGETNRRGAEEAEEETEAETITLDELLVMLEQDADLVQQVGQQLGIEATDPQVIIKALINQFNAADDSTTNEAKFWFNQGVDQYNSGNFASAIASYDRAIEIKPDYDSAWYNRGVALTNLGRFEQAIASYDRAIQIKPDLHDAWNYRGATLDNLGRFEEAIASYDNAIKIKPDFHIAWIGRGVALDNLGRFEEAIASFDTALKIKPDDHEAWYNRGVPLSKLGQFEQAIAFYDNALKIKLDLYQAWYNRGNALGKLGQFEEAIASFDSALKTKPNHHLSWYDRGNALDFLGKHEQAIASYDSAIKFKPDLHLAWINRGIAAGNVTGERTDFSLTSTLLNAASPNLALKFNNPDLNKRGYDGTLASYEEGLKHCPQDTHPEGWGQLHQRIGDAHYFRGRGNYNARYFWNKAVNSYKTALQTLTATDFPELHLEVLRDLIRVQLDLKETAEATELQRQGTDLLRRLLNEPNRSDKSKKQLALKFAWIQQLTVDLAVQSGDLPQAIELAEEGKNTCLRWLLDGWNDEISSPSYSEMQQLLNPSTAVVYWHLSSYALHTFILKHNAPSPIVLEETEFVTQAQRLQDFEDWVKSWNQQYADYRKGKNKQGKKAITWRDNLPEMLRNLSNILNINAVVSEIPEITQLILIPHRDLHRFPLHALFPPEFTITYLPSAKIGLIPQTYLQKRGDEQHNLLSIEHPNSKGYPHLEFAQIESEAISRMFPNHSRKRSEKATKAAIINALPQDYSILHFTGHGEYNFQNPALSHLALAGEDKLTLADIRNFNLQSYQLVTLAACETAITGNHTITTEYVGLVSGFMGCGVAHVVSTLWTVESAASALIMIQFYQLLQQKQSEAVALAKATQWLRNVTNAELAEWYAVQIAKLPQNEGIIRPFLQDQLNDITIRQTTDQPYNDHYHWAAFTIIGAF
ncbi:tetratricopeptide repeat protein [Nostoc sp. JL33]|uniref:CHAT domain-containing protein n=1 Tax=Nostoc sp. JL33 TaxID=2815396 RepID=UPI0025FA94C1|nr:tetratricopeptide repeat protein [Nostoc sp. JL33]MBN3869893.1 tetratricopeptide repeat protein [Nostoc sp. JL33]